MVRPRNNSRERTISCLRTINSGGFLLSLRPFTPLPTPRATTLSPLGSRDFRFPSRLNPLAVTGRAIINARGKPNRGGGDGLLWDDHNIWTASS